jgi:hypothetical protein
MMLLMMLVAALNYLSSRSHAATAASKAARLSVVIHPRSRWRRCRRRWRRRRGRRCARRPAAQEAGIPRTIPIRITAADLALAAAAIAERLREFPPPTTCTALVVSSRQRRAPDAAPRS